MSMADIKRLDDLELFADCKRTELRKIQPLTTLIRVAKDQVLMREGGAPQQFIVVGGGTARLTRETEEGVTTVADIGSGEFIGESALLSGTRLTTTATAATDLTVFVSSASEFRSILRIAPSVAQKVRRSSDLRSAATDQAA
jgi:CRP/FNR family transcriptional regulator, cyclic AMP receptor protein